MTKIVPMDREVLMLFEKYLGFPDIATAEAHAEVLCNKSKAKDNITSESVVVTPPPIGENQNV